MLLSQASQALGEPRHQVAPWEAVLNQQKALPFPNGSRTYCLRQIETIALNRGRPPLETSSGRDLTLKKIWSRSIGVSAASTIPLVPSTLKVAASPPEQTFTIFNTLLDCGNLFHAFLPGARRFRPDYGNPAKADLGGTQVLEVDAVVRY